MILKDYNFWKYTCQDPIHGGINLGPIEKEIIDHSYFQRLRGLRQNSLLHLVFPAANHTRFDHSLGVMFLADKFFDSIIRNQKFICENYNKKKHPQSEYRVSGSAIEKIIDAFSGDQYYQLLTRCSALFHDIGHGPFSHLFKNFFPTGKYFKNLIKGKNEYKHLETFFSASENLTGKIEHEHLSCLIATRVLMDASEILKTFGIEPDKFAQDICSLIEVGIKPSEQLKGFEYEVHPLFNQIISGIIDADRMDYLLRDSQMCGVNYGLYEPHRILKSMCAYADVKKKCLMIAIRYSALDAFEDFIFSRYQMHKQIYGHKTNRACSAMLEKIRSNLSKEKWKWYEKCHTVENFLEKFTGFNDSSFVRHIGVFGKRKNSIALMELTENLFNKRKLLKRGYEEITDTKQKDYKKFQKKWTKIKTLIEKKGIWVEYDCFENKVGKIDADCPMKVLKKSAVGNYLVKPFSELRSLSSNLPKNEVIFRAYFKSNKIKDVKAILKTNRFIE